MCSQTEITRSGWKFERTTVWTMVWRWSDQRLFGCEKSGPWSEDDLIRIQIGLKSLIIGWFEGTWVWSEANSSAIGSDHNLFERTWIWSEAISSAFGSYHNLFERILIWSEATSSAIVSHHSLFERIWIWSKATLSWFWSDHNLFEHLVRSGSLWTQDSFFRLWPQARQC